MKNFDPVGFTRSKWYDPLKIKNRPISCDKSHSFCNLEYQWGNQGNKMKPINRPINPSIPNVDLPVSSQKVINVNYDSMTQQNLDDWIAQSINRSLLSMLNPQKKFFLPTPYDEQLRHRYRKKKQITSLPENETYFNTGRKKKRGVFSTDRRQKVNANDLCFDYRKLQPHQDLIGIPIKIREMKKIQKKQIKRRNAVLLNYDVHYARFLKQANKQKSVHVQAPTEEQELIPTKKMIYSYNIQSMNRKSCYDNVPCSLIEIQYQRIKQPGRDLLTAHRALMSKQEQLHQKYRVQMNQKANIAINHMKEMSSAPRASITNESMGISSYKKNVSLIHKTIVSQIHGQAQKDKKYLQNKIIKIMNDMQVQAEAINQDMSRLNIHINQIILQHPDTRPQTKWILKAQEKIKDHKNLLAIDCYKQAIILQPEMFIPVFNIAVLLQRQNMLEGSRQWFNLARQFGTDSQNVLFGISLVALKQLRYNQSLIGINELITKLQTNNNKKILSVYYYIRALCNKQLGYYKQAKADYKTIQCEFKPTNYNVLPDVIFSVVYARIRRIHLKFNCLSYMLLLQNISLILYQNKKKIKDADQSLVDIADKLIKGPFFCRFSISLVKRLLAIATYQQKQKGQLIFCSKNATSIIINGMVSLKSHQKQFIKPQMVTVLSKGGLIGAGSLQNNIGSRPNNWFTAQSKVQMITVPRDDFQLFWKGQITFEVDFKYCFLKYVDIFKGLSECTLFKLCQLFQKKVYQKGEILFNDCSYRSEILGRPGKGYGFAKSVLKTDARMLNSNTAVVKQGKERRRQRSKIYKIIKKHLFKFNQMKFNRLKYPGMFIVVKGMVELEDDRGFRCSGMIGQRDFFGENLFLDSDGYQDYGRMVVESQTVQVLLLNIEKIVWLFNLEDKQIMIENCKSRQAIQTVRFLRNRFNQCQSVKQKCKMNN